MTTFSQTHATHTHRPVSKGLFARIAAFVAVRRQRRALAQLDDAALKDIGVSRAEAQAEATRPGWDVPGHWLR